MKLRVRVRPTPHRGHRMNDFWVGYVTGSVIMFIALVTNEMWRRHKEMQRWYGDSK
jgi:hypothetical protein